MEVAMLTDGSLFDRAAYRKCAGRVGEIPASRKQDGRQPLAALDGSLVGRTPGFEELHQLLARAVLVPFAVALDDFQKLRGSLGALAGGIQRDREIEARLMVQRVGGDLLFEFGERAERLRL